MYFLQLISAKGAAVHFHVCTSRKLKTSKDSPIRSGYPYSFQMQVKQSSVGTIPTETQLIKSNFAQKRLDQYAPWYQED